MFACASHDCNALPLCQQLPHFQQVKGCPSCEWANSAAPGHVCPLPQVIALLQRHANIEELNLKGVAPGYANEGFFRAVLPRLRQ